MQKKKDLIKLARDKSVVRWTDRPDMTIAVNWDVNNKTKRQTKQARIILILKRTSSVAHKKFTPGLSTNLNFCFRFLKWNLLEEMLYMDVLSYAEKWFVLSDKQIEKMRMPLSIVCIRGHMSECPKLKIVFILANIENSDEMPRFAACHLVLQYCPKYAFRSR